MLETVKQFFQKATERQSRTTAQKIDHRLLVAVCALLVEMARIDEVFTPAELEMVLSILREKYGLGQDEAEALMAEAETALRESVDLWQFAKLINENYSKEDKLALIETLWQIVYVDGKMDRYEHYLMNKLSNLLRLTHKQLIDAKLKVLYANRGPDQGDESR